MIRRTFLTTIICLWLAGVASAQQPARSFDALKFTIAIGDTISVADATGHEIKGRVTAISDTSLTLAVDGTSRSFAAADVSRVDRRRRDSTKNGALIGAGTGALVGFGVGRAADSPSCPRPGIECGQGSALGAITGALWGAAGGWIADTLIRSREILYLAPGTP